MLLDFTHFLTYWKKFGKWLLQNKDTKIFVEKIFIEIYNKRRGELRGISDC
jgi:phage pi2 protein 07